MSNISDPYITSVLASILKLQEYLFKDTLKVLSYPLMQSTYFSW